MNTNLRHPAILIFVFAFQYCVIIVKTQQLSPSACPTLPDFPPNIKLTIQSFRTYGREMKIPFTYVVQVRNALEVVLLSNWAYQHTYRIRAIGNKHSWSPMIFAPGDNQALSCPKTILVDTTAHLNSMKLDPIDPKTPHLRSVTVESGVNLRTLLEFLEYDSLGLYATPTISKVTVGGMLAVGAHGTGIGILSDLDNKSPGHTYGTISNLVVEMTLVAWDKNSSSYHLKTLTRSGDKDIKAFLTNIGRTFVTSVSLRVGKNQMLRSQSHFNIKANELFAHPSKVKESSKTAEKFINLYGRVNIVGFGIGENSKMWVISIYNEPQKPPQSREAFQPYNYFFMNYIPSWADGIIRSVLRTRSALWNTMADLLYNIIVYGSQVSNSIDFWGPSKNHFIFISEYFPSFQASSLTVTTSHKNIQMILYILRKHYDALAKEYKDLHNEIPSAGDFNIRFSGVENAEDVEIPDAETPSLSNAAPVPEFPEYDLVIWCEFSGFNDNPHYHQFIARLTDLFYSEIHRKYGIIRVEWSKAWAHTDDGPWTNLKIMNEIIPRSFSTSDQFLEWNWAIRTLNAYDPHKIFSNEFLDSFLVEH